MCNKHDRCDSYVLPSRVIIRTKSLNIQDNVIHEGLCMKQANKEPVFEFKEIAKLYRNAQSTISPHLLSLQNNLNVPETS